MSRKYSESLTSKYKQGNYALSKEEVSIYLDVRFPATKAVVKRIFSLLIQENKLPTSFSLLDCGAGPATSLAALEEIDVDYQQPILLERNQDFIDLSKNLDPNYLQFYKKCDFTSLEQLETKDVCLFSYSLNELSKMQLDKVMDKTFSSGCEFVVIIEPGTPKGYQTILTCRDFGIKQGFGVVSPCPHNQTCPLIEGDWCHFATRVERSKTHRQLKGGTLSYEDEKFSYVVLSKKHLINNKGRILARPLIRKGLIQLKLCTTEGVQNKTYTKSNTNNFKSIKKLHWGDQTSE